MIQEDLVTLLSPAVSNRVYGAIAAQNTLIPYIVYQRVVTGVENVLAGNGTPPINQTRMQIDAWSNTYASVQALAATIRGLMQGWNKQNIELSEQDLYEQDTRMHRVTMDYSIFHYN